MEPTAATRAFRKSLAEGAKLPVALGRALNLKLDTRFARVLRSPEVLARQADTGINIFAHLPEFVALGGLSELETREGWIEVRRCDLASNAGTAIVGHVGLVGRTIFGLRRHYFNRRIRFHSASVRIIGLPAAGHGHAGVLEPTGCEEIGPQGGSVGVHAASNLALFYEFSVPTKTAPSCKPLTSSPGSPSHPDHRRLALIRQTVHLAWIPPYSRSRGASHFVQRVNDDVIRRFVLAGCGDYEFSA